MNHIASLLIFCSMSICGTVFAASPKAPVGVVASPAVIRADFGLFNPPDSGKPAFVPAKVVPLVPNQRYGWLIVLRTESPKVKWREEFTLPAKPKTWGDPEPVGSRSVSTDGRVSITEREVVPDRGVIFNAWAVAPGDPKGRYVIRVFVENSLVGFFEFDVL